MRQENTGSSLNGDPSRHNQSSQSTRLEPPDNSSQTSDRLAEELVYYRSFLEQLLEVVRNGDQDTVNQMVSMIRSDASQQQILAALSENSANDGQTAQGARGRNNHNPN
ncbi:hypothetical protein BO79DRAFT_256966 [Aspergillus costaricaensis CBS 115574]|uniref:Uncharacterized protein n=1 Tax=Aspergillus costaricaensis CBS 115574 TaxID=1448317 RepID=A0ACD1IB80_9EURO|nr:hypothetical protein BO79DRAFT_256966 [Aspergillus costaricaensis CBS 115574]RAK87025.1 hypothetical protein BO79DRAFT_256966 [Aspergillus costaricaensis CBS 115574]